MSEAQNELVVVAGTGEIIEDTGQRQAFIIPEQGLINPKEKMAEAEALKEMAAFAIASPSVFTIFKSKTPDGQEVTKKHPNVEFWQAMMHADGAVFTIKRSWEQPDPLNKGHVEFMVEGVLTRRNGTSIEAVASCSSAENSMRRHAHQMRAMAQTRVQARLGRMTYAFVLTALEDNFEMSTAEEVENLYTARPGPTVVQISSTEKLPPGAGPVAEAAPPAPPKPPPPAAPHRQTTPPRPPAPPAPHSAPPNNGPWTDPQWQGKVSAFCNCPHRCNQNYSEGMEWYDCCQCLNDGGECGCYAGGEGSVLEGYLSKNGKQAWRWIKPVAA